jgi:hypothetical protein
MGIPIQNTHMYSLNFADDQVIIAQDHDDMEFMAQKLKEEYEKWGLTMNLEKTKYICIGEEKGSLKFDSREQIKYRMYLFRHKDRPDGRQHNRNITQN